MNRRSLGWGVLVVVGFVALTAGLWWSREHFKSQTAQLPDGSTVIFRGVTYGTKHYPPGKPWERLLAFLPKGLANRFGVKVAAVQSTTSPTLVFWYAHRGRAPGGPDLEWALADASGFESRMQGFHASSSGPSENLEGRGSTAFPRRSKTIRFRLYSRDSNYRPIRVAEFTINHPVPGIASVWEPESSVYPVWKPEPLPQTKSAGDLQMTLLGLNLGNGAMPSQFSASSRDTMATARFRFVQGGHVTTNWEAIKITMSDAPGNRLASTSWSNQSKDGDELFQFNPTLWPEEPAWKLQVEFSRKTEADFASNELWRVTGIAVPDPTSFTQVDRTNLLLGSSVHLIGLFGAQGRLPTGRSMYSGSAAVQIDVAPMPDGMRLTLVSVTDDQGRKVERSGASWGNGQHSFGLKWPPDAKTLDLTLALHKSRFAEYLIKPTTLPGDTDGD